MGNWLDIHAHRITGLKSESIRKAFEGDLAKCNPKRDWQQMSDAVEGFLRSSSGTYLVEGHTDYSSWFHVWHDGELKMRWAVPHNFYDVFEVDLVYCLCRFGGNVIFVTSDLRPLQSPGSQVVAPIEKCSSEVRPGDPLILDRIPDSRAVSGAGYLAPEFMASVDRKFQPDRIAWLPGDEKFSVISDAGELPSEVDWCPGDGSAKLLLTPGCEPFAQGCFQVRYVLPREITFGYRRPDNQRCLRNELVNRGAPVQLTPKVFEASVRRGSILTKPAKVASRYVSQAFFAPRLMKKLIAGLEFPSWLEHLDDS